MNVLHGYPTPSHEEKSLHRVGDSVVYFCDEGYKFKIEPPDTYYSVSCSTDGTWSDLPKGSDCEGDTIWYMIYLIKCNDVCKYCFPKYSTENACMGREVVLC